MSDDTMIAAIGDVHGEAGLLRTMLEGLAAVGGDFSVRPTVFFLGDIVDRGEESRGAMDIVCAELSENPQSRLLLGNHDDWLLRFLLDDLDADEIDTWLQQGGAETLASYGAVRGETADDARRRILSDRPHHLECLKAASIVEIRGRFAFAHAGIDPRSAVDRQRRDDCLWIRGRFQRHVGLLSHVIVHGHQPQKGGRPVVTENRMSIDTGAVFSGRLSCALVEPRSGAARFFQARPGGRFAEIPARRLDRGMGTAIDRAPGT